VESITKNKGELLLWKFAATIFFVPKLYKIAEKNFSPYPWAMAK
jgi:hypothetical protein